MTSLDDLRATLQDHSCGMTDRDVAVRAASVHRRVGVVRRRRRAAISGAAAVLVVAGGVALLPGGDENVAPEPSTDDVLVGVDVPPTMESLGFTYALNQSAEGGLGRVRVALSASSEPRLVSWATAGDEQGVTVEAPTLSGPTAYDVPDFGDFTYVPAGSRATVEVRADQGEPVLTLAVYTLSDDRPAGTTKDGVTFRRDVAEGTLLGAAVGDPGQEELSVPATATGPGVSYRYFCSGGPADAYLHIAYLRDERQELVDGAGCDDDTPVDAAAMGGTGRATRPGNDVGVRFYVTEGPDGPPLSSPGLRLGIGVYGLDHDPVGPEGFLPATLEHGGHVWRRVDVLRSTDGSREVTGTAPADEGVVLAVVYGNVVDGSVVVRADLGGSPGVGLGGGGATQQVMPAGGDVRVSATGGVLEPDDEFGAALYVVAD